MLDTEQNFRWSALMLSLSLAGILIYASIFSITKAKAQIQSTTNVDSNRMLHPLSWEKECIHCAATFPNLTPENVSIDDLNQIHIVYGQDALYHTWQENGQWLTEIVDSNESLTDVQPAIAIHDDEIHISYKKNYRLHYARKIDSNWEIEILDGEEAYFDSAIAISPQYPFTRHIIYSSYIVDFLTPLVTNTVKHIYTENDTWVEELIYTTRAINVDVRISPAAPYTLYIAYEDRVDYNTLKFGWRDSQAWHLEEISNYVIEPFGIDLELSPIYPFTPTLVYAQGSSSFCVAQRGAEGWDKNAHRFSNSGGRPILWGFEFEKTDPNTIHVVYSLFQSSFIYPDSIEHQWGNPDSLENEILSQHTGYGALVSTSLKDQPIKAVYTWDDDSLETPYFKRELRYVSQISSTWTYSVVNVSGAAGIQNDLALEPSSPYSMQIAYIYRDTLNYAYRNGTDWIREVVDHITTPSFGQHLSLAISPKTPFTPSIAYYDETDNELKYAYKDGPTWKKQVVSFGGLAPSLALSSVEPFTPHISYIDEFVMHAWWAGTEWTIETIDSNGVPDTLFTNIQLSAGHPNYPVIVYADKKQDSLNFASYDNDNWSITPIAELDPDCTGRHLDAMSAFALETEPPYFPHVTFIENPRRIEHIWQTNSGWHSETVDIYPYISAIEGIDIAIALSPSSPPDIYLGYSHRTDLYYAFKRNGKWLVSKNKIKTTGWGDIQRHVSLALAPTEESLFFTYVDPNMGDLIMLTSKDAENLSFLPVIFAISE